MEVVSTLNLVSYETEKTTVAIFKSWDLLLRHMIWWEAKSEFLQTRHYWFIVSWWQYCRKTPYKARINKTTKSKATSNENALSFTDNLIRAKKIWWSISCKTINKPDQNLVGLRKKVSWRRRSFVIDTMARRHKISKESNIVWHWHRNITNSCSYN